MFERSVEGQNNRALFYGVDFVLYTEGGRKEDGYSESYDALFWKLVFRELNPGVHLKVIARGSKENLRDFIGGVVSGTLENVLVARDRDYDDLLGKAVVHPRVLYTFGYSYENDIFREEAVPGLFEVLCPLCEIDAEVADTISGLYRYFSNAVWWVSKADFCGVLAGRAVIDRRNPNRYIVNARYGSKPELNMSEFYKSVRKANEGAPRDRIVQSALKREMVPRRAVGHLIAAFVFRLLCFLQKTKSTVQNLTHDSVRTAAVQSFASSLRRDPADELQKYYRAMIGSVQA